MQSIEEMFNQGVPQHREGLQILMQFATSQPGVNPFISSIERYLEDMTEIEHPFKEDSFCWQVGGFGEVMPVSAFLYELALNVGQVMELHLSEFDGMVYPQFTIERTDQGDGPVKNDTYLIGPLLIDSDSVEEKLALEFVTLAFGFVSWAYSVPIWTTPITKAEHGKLRSARMNL